MKKRLMQMTRAALAAAFLLFTAAATDGALAQESGQNAQAEPGMNTGGPGGWGRDEDGDGIPNGQDPDYDRQNPMRGHGQMGFVDENGDGINDRCRYGDGYGNRDGWSSGHGTPGYGPGNMHRGGGRHGNQGHDPWGGGHGGGMGPRGGMGGCGGR